MRSISSARVVIASLGVSVVLTLGCGKPPAGPSPSPSPTVTAQFGGRVVNADAAGPVEGVRVSLWALSSPRSDQYVRPTNTATSAGDGTFTLSVNLPLGWSSVSLKLTAPPGYDDRYSGSFIATGTQCVFGPCWVPSDRPDIRMYPTVAIRPGESIDVRVDSGIVWCGWDGDPCRRVLLAASADDSVELEVVPYDSSKPMALGLAIPGYCCVLDPDMSVRRLMVPPGGVPYVIGAGTARLTARR